MGIDKILPYKKFSNQDEWKDDSTYDKMRQVDLVGFSFYLGEIRLLNTADSFHSVIGVSSIGDYNQYGLQSLGDILHDYVMNLFFPFELSDELKELTKTFKIMLQYFDIPTDKESYCEVSTVGLKTRYVHIESGIEL